MKKERIEKHYKIFCKTELQAVLDEQNIKS